MKNRGSDRAYLIVALVCFIFLGILAVFNYEDQNEVVGSFVDSYYRGYKITSMDSKSLYGALNAYGSTSASACIINPKTAASDKLVLPCDQTMPWVQTTDATTTDKATAAAKVVDCMPFSDGDYIVAPGDLMFLNSNVSCNKTDISIQATIGTKYKIVFSHVQEWWCHMDSTANTYSHSDVVGYGSSNNTDRVIVGTIIGKANSSTIVEMYYDNGSDWVKCTLEDYYLNRY